MGCHEITEDIHRRIVQFADEDRACALAIVVNACGSTPCAVGAQAIMDADRVLAGTIGGGSVEVGAEARTVPAFEAAFMRARPAGPRSSGLG